MADLVADLVRRQHRRGHERLLKMVESLTEEQWHWRPTPAAHNIAFGIWHAARHDDWLQAQIRGLVPDLAHLGRSEQIWQAEDLARRWRLEPHTLGFGETGTSMDDSVAAALPLPGGAALLDYARRTFAAIEGVVAAIRDDQLPLTVMTMGDETHTLAYVLVGSLLHDEWVIGYTAALRRAQGLPPVEG